MEDGLVLHSIDPFISKDLWVLILVVVEDGLVLITNAYGMNKYEVLILVVVEDGLVQQDPTVKS